MKLHLPKMLFTALIAAVAVGTSAQAGSTGWNKGELFINETGTLQQGTNVNQNGMTDVSRDAENGITIIGTADATGRGNLTIFSDGPNNEAIKSEIGTLTIDNGATISVKKPSWGPRNFDALTIENLNVNNSGTVNLNVEYIPANNHPEELVNKVIINSVSGKLGTVTVNNGGDLTIGTDANSSTTFSSAITNSGTLTINGTVTLEVNETSNFEAISGCEASYSYDSEKHEGFKSVAAGEYYLIKDNAGTLSIAEQAGLTINKEGDAIKSITFTGNAYTGTFFLINGSDIDEAELIADTATTGVTATTKYSLAAGSLTVAGDISTADRLTYTGGTLNMGAHKLTITDAASASALLLNTTGTGTVELTANATIKNEEATKATGHLKISNGAELKLGNGDLQNNTTTPAANINTFASLELDNGKLNITTRTLELKNVTVTGNGGRIHMDDIGSKADNAVNLSGTTTLTGDLKLNNFYNAQINVEKLAGSGKLVIEETSRLNDGGEVLKVTVSGKDSGYTGEVQVKNSANRLVVAAAEDLGLNVRYSTSNGTMDLSSIGSGNTVILNGAAGGIKAGTIAADVKLENTNSKAGVEILTAGDNDSITYTGKISGDNYLINTSKTVQEDDGNGGTIDKQVAVNTSTTFSGDTSEWTGQMRVIKGEQNITFTGDATTSANSWVIDSGATANVTLDHAAAATVKKNIAKGSGTLNLTVKNSSTEGTTLNAADVNALSVGDNTKLSLAGAAEAESVTMGEGASLNFAGGSLTTSDSLTLNAISIDFSKYATTQLEHTLVSASSLALGGSVDLDSLGSTVGSYTATISQSGSKLLLTYAVKPVDTIDWSITDLGGYDAASNILTLNVGADLTGYDFTENGTIIIPGISDSIMKEILGLTDLPEDGMVGIRLMGTDGQDLTATADQQIGFQGKDGVSTYFGQNVDGNWQYYVQYIPEPATATLSLLALAGLAARRRRK